MIILVVGDNQAFRRTHIEAATPAGSEVLWYDDVVGTVAGLEQYVYPSLFSIHTPVLHVKFLLTQAPPEHALIQKLLASPTIFIFEEFTVPASLVATFKKSGAVVHVDDQKKKASSQSDIFSATLALTAKDKKARWMAYRETLATYPIEAIIGILYWKVKDMIAKNPKDKKVLLVLYGALLEAHAGAWESGTPLELAIEKVILTQ